MKPGERGTYRVVVDTRLGSVNEARAHAEADGWKVLREIDRTVRTNKTVYLFEVEWVGQ